MTRITQKSTERQFVTAAAKLMNRQWGITARVEHAGGPDFIVCDANRTFGLEVMA